MKVLLFVPVGEYCLNYLDTYLSYFDYNWIDKILINYDNTNFECKNRATWYFDTGQKWQLAKKYLKPSEITEYDYIFLWDDDLKIVRFDIIELIDILERNKINVAQPSLSHDSYYSHLITLNDCTQPIGRKTNFVEIMCPIFKKEAWNYVYDFLTEDNRMGWGYDSIPYDNKAIIDKMIICHTKPSTITEEAGKDCFSFLGKHNFNIVVHEGQQVLESLI